MARYTLDYSTPSPVQRRTRSDAQRWPLLVALLGLYLGLMSGIYAYHLRAENLFLRQQRDALVLRYDSLLNVSQPPRRLRMSLGTDFQERRPSVPVKLTR